MGIFFLIFIILITVFFLTGVDDVTEKLVKCEIQEPTFNNSSQTPPTQLDPVKRLKNLKKKLREIEALEEKIKTGTLKNPDKEQKEKISRKNEIIKEIEMLDTVSDP